MGGQIISNFALPLFCQLWGKSMSLLSSHKEDEALDHLPGRQKCRLSLPPQHGGWGAASGARPCELKPTPLPAHCGRDRASQRVELSLDEWLCGFKQINP